MSICGSVYSPDRAQSPDLTGSDRIGPEIGLFLCLTDCFFFFTRMMCIKDYVFSAICMHLNIY